jgi:predicted adenylyl cyclase CyaB
VREVELKAVVADPEKAQRLLADAGAKVVFEGVLADRRYDAAGGELNARDEVIRVRAHTDKSGTRASLDWKGPSSVEAGFKVREEISTGVSDERGLVAILEKLGYSVVREIDRKIVQYEAFGATVRFEFYPRMDTLVEVEGSPESIERAVEALGMSRGEFSSEALAAFVNRFEQRTGVRAAISERELTGP